MVYSDAETSTTCGPNRVYGSLVDEWMTVSEEYIAHAMVCMHGHHGQQIEGAAAVTVASIMKKGLQERMGKQVVAIVCGGNVAGADVNYYIPFDFLTPFTKRTVVFDAPNLEVLSVIMDQKPDLHDVDDLVQMLCSTGISEAGPTLFRWFLIVTRPSKHHSLITQERMPYSSLTMPMWLVFW